MANDSFRRAVDGRLSHVSMSPELKNRIRKEVAVERARPKKARQPITFKRVMAAGLAAVMTLAFGLTVVAAVVPSFERLLLTIGDVRDLLQPINLECENGGVRMEVIAAINDGETAYVYLNMQDTEDKGLITEETKLLDVAFGDEEFIRAELIAFEEETGTATYRLQWSDSFTDISGQRTTLHIEGLLLGEEWLHEVDTGYTLADIMEMNPTPEIADVGNYETRGMQFGENESLGQRVDEMYQNGTMPMLAKNGLEQPLDAIPWLPITSAGVVDGLLHIQVQNEDFLSRFNRPYVYLEYPGYEDDWLMAADSSHNSLGNTSWYEQYEFQEWVLEIPENVEPKDIRVMAGGPVVAGYYEAGWEVTFTFDGYVEVLEWHCNIDLGSWQVKRLELSPIGVTAFGHGEMGEGDAWLEMEAVLYDGTVVETDSASVSSNFTGEIISKVGFKGLVDPGDVEKIIINGQEYSVASAHVYEETENAA